MTWRRTAPSYIAIGIWPTCWRSRSIPYSGRPCAPTWRTRSGTVTRCWFRGGLQPGVRSCSWGPDAGTVPVQLSFSPLDVQGARGLCVIATDLSQQKRNADILAAERLAHSILEQAADAIVVCGRSGEIIRASASACRLSGGQCVGAPFAAAFPLLAEDGAAGSTPPLAAARCNPWRSCFRNAGRPVGDACW